MDTIIYQGSGGTIGDIFFSSAPMYHIKKTYGKKIVVALPKDLNPEIRDLYNHHLFLDDIHELDSIKEEAFIPHAQSLGFEPSLFLRSLGHLKGMRFYKLDEWFRNPAHPSFEGRDCVSVQLMSTTHWDRPPIPGWKAYLELIHRSGLKAMFVGTKKDEERLVTVYKGIREYCPSEDHWRFGKDTILETLANLRLCHGALVFSSWTAYGAVLQMVPAMELWNKGQWQYYTPMTKYMLGSPIHYLQESFDSPPVSSVFVQVFPRMRQLANLFYT